MICQGSQFTLFPSQTRRYSDSVKDSDRKQDGDVRGVESTVTVPSDPDLTTTESPELQNRLPSPPTELSSSPFTKKASSVIHFRIPSKRKNPKDAATELRTAMSETSLRKKLGWSNPLRGVNPAYDMALIYLNQDRQQKIKVIKKLVNRIRNERKRTDHFPFPPSSLYSNPTFRVLFRMFMLANLSL